MASNYKSFNIPNFIGGIREDIDSSLIKSNETPLSQNMSVDDGALSTGMGYRFTTMASNNDPIKGLMVYYSNGEEILLVAAGGWIRKWISPVWVVVGTGFQSDSWDYINDNIDDKDVIVLTNGVDNVKIYDGTTIRDLKKNGKNSTAGAENVIKGQCIDMHYERLWVVDENNIYFSTANRNGFDIEDFTAPVAPPEEVNEHGGQIVLYSNDSSKAIGIKVVFDDILLYKPTSIWKITGSTPDNYEKVRIFSATGAISDKSIVTTPKGAFHVDRRGIYFYDGVNVRMISKKISKTFANLNKTGLKNAVAVYWENKYILAVPEYQSETNNLIIEYNIDEDSFMIKRGMTVTSFAECNNTLYFTNGTNTVFEYGKSNSMLSTSMECYYETGYTDLNEPNAVKEIESIYFTASGLGNLKISVTTENGTKSKTITLSSTEKVYPVRLSHRGRLIKIRFDNVDGSRFNLKGLKVIYDPDYD